MQHQKPEDLQEAITLKVRAVTEKGHEAVRALDRSNAVKEQQWPTGEVGEAMQGYYQALNSIGDMIKRNIDLVKSQITKTHDDVGIRARDEQGILDSVQKMRVRKKLVLIPSHPPSLIHYPRPVCLKNWTDG